MKNLIVYGDAKFLGALKGLLGGRWETRLVEGTGKRDGSARLECEQLPDRETIRKEAKGGC
ncbi:MAG: hypothetical protein HYV04_18130 [Deltaproteobacteria bacterium]|nr:hypothetical protein [Deltaproteobacteria bacterium]